MPTDRHYRDSTPESNPEHHKNTWEPIGALVAADVERLRAKRDAALERGLTEAGETYHHAMWCQIIGQEIGGDG